ncbi:hypothetical protein FA95DRAFT_1223281 [Auriscalpium vulgare]|uniref:Uncharacterized protein n=1 Tax=Auriscalpium vulgare TaxID=40419 RepID=A0ACB8RTF9_9AGAM|nr:hypothetical protein FA95DRAFT_1223281 [Auriscalpium vulgare]
MQEKDLRGRSRRPISRPTSVRTQLPPEHASPTAVDHLNIAATRSASREFSASWCLERPRVFPSSHFLTFVFFLGTVSSAMGSWPRVAHVSESQSPVYGVAFDRLLLSVSKQARRVESASREHSMRIESASREYALRVESASRDYALSMESASRELREDVDGLRAHGSGRSTTALPASRGGRGDLAFN